MKKNISDEKLDEMLRNLYNSEVSESFEFKSNLIADKPEFNPQITVSGSEKHIKKKFIPAKIAAIAAAALIIVNIGIININDSNSTFSEPSNQNDSSSTFSEPSTQIADIPVGNCEVSLFDDYLKEFEYEINNFDYECIKVTANPETGSDEESQNYIYGSLCHDMNIVPAYENCSFIDSDISNQSLALTDEDFYFYIKKIIVPISENESAISFTRQSYLVWKDVNGNITKIRPSAEKVTAEDIENKLECSYYSDEPIQKLMSDFSNENCNVYIDNTLVRPAISDENRIGEPEVYMLYRYYAYMNINGQLTPIYSETVVYNSKSIIEVDDNYKETENIPFLYSNINDYNISIRKTFLWNCSDTEPDDVSSYISELNKNYWLETAETSSEYVSENMDETPMEFENDQEVMINEEPENINEIPMESENDQEVMINEEPENMDEIPMEFENNSEVMIERSYSD